MEVCERTVAVAERLVRLCAERGLTVATAESCTAGMVAAALGGVPGASAVLRGGAVTYCDEIKHAVLGVDCEALETYTAVSEQVAAQMASGACERFGSSLAVSVTGYAGPGGGTPRDPAGTVYIATCDDGLVRTCRHQFPGTRNEVRAAAALTALEMLLERAETL